MSELQRRIGQRRATAISTTLALATFALATLHGESATQQWASAYTPGFRAEPGKGVAVDPAGDVFFLGTNVTRPSNTFGEPDPQQFYTAKYAGRDGRVFWVKTFGGTTETDYAFARALAVDREGNVVVAGATRERLGQRE